MQELTSVKSREDTRSRILAATRQLVARKGRRGTTTREIAELAGVNEATLFRHFGNKDAIIDACVQRFCATIELQELLASLDGDLEGDLRRIGLALAERMEAIRDLIVMSLVEEEQDTPVGAAAWRAPAAIKQVVADYMARRVAAGDLVGDPPMLARFFMGMIFAYVVGRKKFADERWAGAAQMVAFQVDIFLNGVRKKND